MHKCSNGWFLSFMRAKEPSFYFHTEMNGWAFHTARIKTGKLTVGETNGRALDIRSIETVFLCHVILLKSIWCSFWHNFMQFVANWTFAGSFYQVSTEYFESTRSNGPYIWESTKFLIMQNARFLKSLILSVSSAFHYFRNSCAHAHKFPSPYHNQRCPFQSQLKQIRSYCSEWGWLTMMFSQATHHDATIECYLQSATFNLSFFFHFHSIPCWLIQKQICIGIMPN